MPMWFFQNNRYLKIRPGYGGKDAAHAQQIRNYELQFGQDIVEKTIDAVFLSRNMLIAFPYWKKKAEEKDQTKKKKKIRSFPMKICGL